jgi:hypothetical protein
VLNYRKFTMSLVIKSGQLLQLNPEIKYDPVLRHINLISVGRQGNKMYIFDDTDYKDAIIIPDHDGILVYIDTIFIKDRIIAGQYYQSHNDAGWVIPADKLLYNNMVVYRFHYRNERPWFTIPDIDHQHSFKHVYNLVE